MCNLLKGRDESSLKKKKKVLPCVILFLCFSVLLAPRLGKRELVFNAFRTFVRFALVWICLFPLPLGVWEGLRFVILALPGLFSYLFWY